MNPKDERASTVLHSLTLCIDVEITAIKWFINKDIEFHTIIGNQSQVDKYNQFLTSFDEKVFTPFENLIMKTLIDNDKYVDQLPKPFDFIFQYGVTKVIHNLNAATKTLMEDFDGYDLFTVNQDIEMSYPGIEHNPNLFPHIELAQFCHNLYK